MSDRVMTCDAGCVLGRGHAQPCRTPKQVLADAVHHPTHYTDHPSGVECIAIAEHMGFNLGNVVKYVWRHEGKNGLEDLRKARWYLDREIARREVADGEKA